ncbi:glycosyltransferase family 2 protein [Pedobacter sp. GR22-10]|uniref:glycosyltransferase family 2 protein n=1 Tax=Pedobacter sp. GR22-10 TaxID=2994472 RepID=UPI00224510F0|nr:glycosyltransferase family 2 protein [Pedobacter sp. GR22-10]MCX2432370.1 glycosyltransferase family 2 protein [Pedobacter sp. GR22-10]
MNINPLISIVTATYQAGPLIEKTIKSVEGQTYKNIEYIIIDGGSNDEIFEIVDKYKDVVSYFKSEPDSGIYNAWNKGINRANGEWVCFLGAGDEYYHDGVENYVNYINKNSDKNLEFLSSIVDVVDDDGNILFQKGSEWEWPKFSDFMNIAHVGSLHSKRLFEKYGIFDEKYKIVGDYELLLRPKNKLNAGFVNLHTVKMLQGGVSTSLKSLVEERNFKIDKVGMSKTKAFYQYFSAYIKGKLRLKLNKVGVYPKIRQ